MATAAAKVERGTAKRLFTMTMNQLNKSMDDSLSPDIVQKRYSILQAKMDNVLEKHATYLALSHPDDSDPTEEDDSWLQAVTDEFTESEVDCDKYMKSSHNVTQVETHDVNNTQELTRVSRLYKLEIAALESIFKNMKITLNDPTTSTHTIKDAQDEMKTQMERYKSIQREVIILLSNDGDVQTHTVEMQKLMDDYMQFNASSGNLIQTQTKTEQSNSKSKNMTMDLKMERMKMPKFEGDIRDYPRFRRDFNKHVMPMATSKDSAAYILKSCLDKQAFEIIKNVDDDLNEMWTRLDERYGRSSKIVDAIMLDIKQLKPVLDGDGSKFVDLVDTIERCYRDLSCIKMESEICNSTIVSLIEERLPATIKSMWCLEVSDQKTKINDRNKFPEMLEFMLKHKRAIEYGSSDLRSAKKIHFGLHLSQSTASTPNRHHESQSQVYNNNDKRVWCWMHNSSQHDILECRMFKDMTPQSRMDMAYECRVCWCCLRTGHNQSKCFKLKECAKEGCTQKHHPMLHQDDKIKINNVAERDSIEKRPGLLQIMRLRAGIKHTSDINVLWDSGAQVSLITQKKARELGLSGTTTKITIVKIGNQRETVDSKIYKVPIIDSHGEVETFMAYSIPQISSEIESIDTTKLAEELGVNPVGLKRPTGEIEMLVGYEYAGFHPEKIKSKAHLLLLQNKFGKCLGGAHQFTDEKTKMIVQNVQISHASVSIDDFYSNEAIGVSCTPKCGGCRCGECPIGGKQYTMQQERELALIDDGLSHEEGKWTSKYPWIRDPQELPDNYGAASAMLRSLERRLSKNSNHMNIYSDQIQDMIHRKVAQKIESSTLFSYSGPIYYLSHHEVLKPDSESTPCRIVFNSSSKFKGHVLNEYWAKGPDLLNNLLGVLIRFREKSIAIAGDIRKMYHSVAISELDQHTHRFLWRDMDSSRQPDVYKINCVSFGDKPAGAIASLALRKTAEMSQHEFPTASETIRNNSYVDDILGSYDSEEEANRISEEIDTILSKGGFSIKNWIKSSNDSDSTLQVCASTLDSDTDTNLSKVLGVVWNAKHDRLEFVAKVNFSPRHRKMRTEPDLTKFDIPHKIPETLTKRMVLSLVNGIYDPLGLATPFVIQAKMMLRQISQEKNLDWDDPIPENLRSGWIRFFTLLFDMEEIEFRRSTKPTNTIGEPSLVIFSDASEDAFGACAYIRWQIENGSFQSNLVVAKSRLSPMRKTTIPRLELNGALLAARLSNFITKEITTSFCKKYFIVDSEIVRAQIQRESYGFNTFAGVRIGEIQSVTDKNDWYWVEGSKNIADIITRGKNPLELGVESEWQTGPSFLKKAVGEWPVRQTYSGDELPDQAKLCKKSYPCDVLLAQVSAAKDISKIIDIDRYSNYSKLLRVTARIMAAFNHPASLKNMSKIPGRVQVKEAELIWIQSAQTTLMNDIKPETIKRLGVGQVDGIYVVGSRLENWKSHTYNETRPVLLSSKSKFAQLYAQYIHNQCHLGISAVAAKIRAKFWVVGLRTLLKSIKFRCTICKKLDGQFQRQIMGKLPDERSKPAPAWSYISLDMFGPYSIRGETNKRTRSRGYGVIFNCLLTRAIHLDVVSDYSTQSFLMSLRRFISMRGCPMKVYSDRGSQLRAADKELKEIVADIDEEVLTIFGSDNSFEWEFCSPDAPWQNGCSESLIKSVKKSIKIAIGDQILTYSEFQTVLMECANLINERPIGRHPTSHEDGVYLSPNDLLLGRSTSKVPCSQFDVSSSKYQRFKFVQRITDAFWRRWTEDYFPSLIIQQKWHAPHRNIKQGDIVIVQDSNLIRGKWRIGRVTKAEPSLRDGFVRNVEIEYKNPNSKKYLTITRAVQRLIVLVPVDDQV